MRRARETAVMIADRILKSTTYDFVDKKKWHEPTYRSKMYL